MGPGVIDVLCMQLSEDNVENHGKTSGRLHGVLVDGKNSKLYRMTQGSLSYRLTSGVPCRSKVARDDAIGYSTSSRSRGAYSQKFPRQEKSQLVYGKDGVRSCKAAGAITLVCPVPYSFTGHTIKYSNEQTKRLPDKFSKTIKTS
jgi:hypothetical protein